MSLAMAQVGFHRFGLGPRSGDLAKAAADPRAFFADDIARRTSAEIRSEELLTATAAIVAWREEAAKLRAAPPRPPDMAAMAPPPGLILPQRLYRAEVMARLDAAMRAEAGFVERLVWFWANHFAVSAAKGLHLLVIVGAFEREVVRPHVLGRFADMLVAAETHPAMLYYLDNQLSVGPNSQAGKVRGRGLNENQAREALELHTLGSDGGYTQADVTNLARILTGWFVVGQDGRLGAAGSASFNPSWHEPGTIPLLGKDYAPTGADQARAALQDLARHPATARHIATKLARHFVADAPPPALVATLERTFRETDGDLAAVSLALVQAPEAWTPEAVKLRSPQEFLIASFRLLGAPPSEPGAILGPLFALGQAWWQPPEPIGYPDTVAHWASPQGIKTRVDVAARIAQRSAHQDPQPLVDAAFGPRASGETRQAIARAESRAQAIALLLMSPEFQRR